MGNLISQSLQNGILRLTLDTPQKRNALSMALMEELRRAFIEAGKNQQVKVIILGGNGPAFCAGHDLKEMTAARQNDDGGRQFFAQTMATCSNLMQTIVSHPRPVIADIRGIATAAGCQIVASCDLAIASKQSRFSTPGVQIGLFCSTPMVALSRNLSRKHAMEMLLTGEMISAQKAEKIGLINKAVDLEEMDEAVNKLARLIASKPRLTLEIGKSAFYQQVEMDIASAYEFASSVMVDNMLSADASEGIGAFLQKRDPVWSDS